MSKHKVHFEIIEMPGNESNPEDEKFALCGIEEWERGTTGKVGVTCKKCLRIIAKTTAPAATSKETL